MLGREVIGESFHDVLALHGDGSPGSRAASALRHIGRISLEGADQHLRPVDARPSAWSDHAVGSDLIGQEICG